MCNLLRAWKPNGKENIKVTPSGTLRRAEKRLVEQFLMSRVAQSVQCLAMGWTTGRLRFDPRQRQKDFSSGLCVQTGSGAHPASCIMGTGGSFPGLKRGRGVTLTTHPRLVPRSRMSRSYTSSPPKRLRGVYSDSFSF
jgi:hypothetical protein